MFSDNSNFETPKLAPNSSSDVKVVEIRPYPGVNETGPLSKINVSRFLLIFRLEEVFLSQENVNGGFVMFQGQSGKLFHPNPGKLGILQF